MTNFVAKRVLLYFRSVNIVIFSIVLLLIPLINVFMNVNSLIIARVLQGIGPQSFGATFVC